MASVVRRKKALSVSPLKASQPMGATLAILGINRAIPLLHGSQGCTAFAKVYFVRHFREPIPLQTTAIDQISAVMGADDNIHQALQLLCDKHHPKLIGLLSTGLSETQGADLKGEVHRFRQRHPEYADTAIVPINAPDYTGSMETGFANAVRSFIDDFFPEGMATYPGLRKRQVNVLVGSSLTPGDIEFIEESVVSFGLRPIILPNIGDALDGHLGDEEFSPLTTGGTAGDDLELIPESAATLVVGRSMNKAADLLQQRTGIVDHRFHHLMTLEAVDRWLTLLSELSGTPVPEKWRRQRRQLQDAMLDTHFMLGMKKIALGADPDLLTGFCDLTVAMGMEPAAVVATAEVAHARHLRCETVYIGDLEDLEDLARQYDADILLANAHAAATAERLQRPLLRIGFPLYDRVGAYCRCWSGYRGIRDTLFTLANMMLQQHQHIAPYRAHFSPKPMSTTNTLLQEDVYDDAS